MYAICMVLSAKCSRIHVCHVLLLLSKIALLVKILRTSILLSIELPAKGQQTCTSLLPTITSTAFPVLRPSTDHMMPHVQISKLPFLCISRTMSNSRTTGLAHMLEHEAFKGTTRIGTLNWQQERPLLDAQDEGEYLAPTSSDRKSLGL